VQTIISYFVVVGRGLNKYLVQNVIFCPPKITNFVQYFVKISNFCLNLVQLLKGTKSVIVFVFLPKW